MAAKLEDSNCALLGSDEDKKVRHEAALKEPAWQEAGKEPGVQVWRIEQFKVVPWDHAKYDSKHIELYSGDSFIILQTVRGEKDFEYHIFFWLGESTSIDERGTAAYKTVELDAFFDGKASQSREVQGKESAEFRKIFPKITYMAGGVSSGFRHTIGDVYEAHLYQVRKTAQGVVKKEVTMSRDSLNHGDAFVLDAGQKVYIWHGDEAAPMEKYEANIFAEHLEHHRMGHSTATHDLDEQFWKLLGGEGPVKSAAEGSDRIPEVELGEGVLFRLSDADGELKMTEVGRKDLNKSMLDSTAVMLLDHGAEIFLWIGSQASEAEKRNAYRSAMIFLESNERDESIPIHVFKEGKDIQNGLWNKIFSC